MADDFVLIIKPSVESIFQNFVEVLDEVTINNVTHYYTLETGETDRNTYCTSQIKSANFISAT